MRVVLLSLAFGLAACGGGGSEPPGPLAIATQSLDPGNVGFVYFQQLQAQGGNPPYTWTMAPGSDPLPAGLALTSGGYLSGVPSAAAAASVVLVVEDEDGATDLVARQIEVRDIQISGAPAGAVPASTILQFAADGGSPAYAFSFASNGSGGALTSDGTYTAGATSAVDVVRASDAQGFFEELALLVGDDPFAGFTAAWGTTDVWWVNWDVVYDPTPSYATDFDEVLVGLGMRDQSSTDVAGSEADQLARLLVIRRTLGWLSSYYGNGKDGNPQPDGLAISFVGPAGPGTGTTPPPGGSVAAQPGYYSQICVRYGDTGGTIGSAWVDPTNNSIECDCGQPSGTPLGVFANRLLPGYSVSHSSIVAPLTNTPVNAGDVDRLREMLFGEPAADMRAQQIEAVADSFGRVLAAVLAHEVGHSLGLNHSGSAGQPPSAGVGDIMNSAMSLSQGVSYAFNAGHWAVLMDDLPGPNR